MRNLGGHLTSFYLHCYVYTRNNWWQALPGQWSGRLWVINGCNERHLDAVTDKRSESQITSPLNTGGTRRICNRSVQCSLESMGYGTRKLTCVHLLTPWQMIKILTRTRAVTNWTPVSRLQLVGSSAMQTHEDIKKTIVRWHHAGRGWFHNVYVTQVGPAGLLKYANGRWPLGWPPASLFALIRGFCMPTKQWFHPEG